ncbi:MAG: hypothetical protein HZC41_09170 [Chloroflexi bacterium]|nr:hypothetical protein [Chloroflexota bacterium]
MPLTFVSGDPLQTAAQTLAFGHNARARVEVDPLQMRLLDIYPAAFASFRKQCQHGRIRPGAFWTWRESQPHLLFLVIRETAQGATRLRYIESALMTLARDYRLYGIDSLAIAPVGSAAEWPLLKPVLVHWLAACPLPVEVYEGDEGGKRENR